MANAEWTVGDGRERSQASYKLDSRAVKVAGAADQTVYAKKVANKLMVKAWSGEDVTSRRQAVCQSGMGY